MTVKYFALLLAVVLLSAFIPFDDFDGRIDSGWFTLSHDGRYAAVVSVPDTLIVIDLQTGTEAQRVIFPGEVITAEFAADGRLGVITAQDAEFGVWTYDLAADVRESVGTLDEPPVRVWISEVGDVWVEVLTQQAYILNMMTGERLPSAPYADSTAVMRNGRTAAPFAVTSTADGLIKLWHLETGTELGHVQLEMVPDFGRVNDMSGHYLAVNVRASSEVLLLDFDQSAVIARLPVPNGAYIHGLMVMPGGEQVVGVQFDDEPIVGLWDVTTGQFTNLGTFHPCSRVPDLMRLSGTTLVIGCGEGLDVWQLSDMNAPEIRLDNVQHLQSVSHIDFSDFGTFRTGAFSVSPNGEYAAVIDSTGLVHTWHISGEVVNTYRAPLTDSLETAFSPNSDAVYSLHHDEGRVMVIQVSLLDGAQTVYEMQLDGQPQTFWVNDAGIWVEIITPTNDVLIYNLMTGEIVPYAPATDPDAVVRIGRIAPPYAVTSSVDGMVKRWNLQTGEIEAIALVDGGPAVFGQISPDGRYLAWRDPQSNWLHRLDFYTGTDQIVVQLYNQYVQGYFINRAGDVILGVDVDFEPIVVAWDVATGERVLLGQYRECSRVPDLIRMSADGSTLVIGCDTGLDFWRINR